MLLTIVDWFFTLLYFAIIARVLLSWFPQNPYRRNPAIELLERITDPILEPLHRIIPPIGMIDISPIVALVGIQIVQMIVLNALSGLVR